MAGEWSNDETSAAEGEVAISVRNVTKNFKLYANVVTGPLKERLFFWRNGALHKSFVAVNDVNFEVRRGEVVGIIGMNGSGKTTLLKMIAGLLPIDAGRIHVRGKITALLALGVGIHPEFSGRDNIYYSGLLYGMSDAEVTAKMDSIIAFAELGDYIEQPLRTYSSGMRARLLFSIAMSIDPDILIVDEALATGDSYFVRKSSSRIRQLCDSGATVLFVSHNIQQVKELCSRALLLDHGRIVGDGNPLDQAVAYQGLVHAMEGRRAQSRASSQYAPISGTGEFTVAGASMTSLQRGPVSAFYTGERVEIVIDYTASVAEATPVQIFLGIDLAETQQFIGEIHSTRVIDPASGEEQERNILIGPQGRIRICIEPLLLLNNHYSLWFIVHTAESRVLAEYRGLCPFFVSRRAYADQSGGPVIALPARIEA